MQVAVLIVKHRKLAFNAPHLFVGELTLPKGRVLLLELADLVFKLGDQLLALQRDFFGWSAEFVLDLLYLVS